MPSFDVQNLLDEEQRMNENLRPLRFGYAFEVSYTLDDGFWVNGENSKTWSLRIASPDAYSINLIFDELQLSKDAELYLFNSEGTMVFGPIKSDQNIKNETDFFQTELISGDEIIVQLIEPLLSKQNSSFKISRVVHGYVDMFASFSRGLGGSGSCEKDIACYSSWAAESNAVALVLSNGIEACSGALINNTAQNFTPYFLTAFHCIDTEPYPNRDYVLSSSEITVAQNWSFRFGYKKTTCGGNTVSSYTTYNGCTYRASWVTSDFALVEINDYNFRYEGKTLLGWDRSGSTPTSGAGIHHPSGDVMKISFENQSFGTSSYYNGTNNMWWLSYDIGVVEPGSSGSPILDQNKRIVGQLFGTLSFNPSLPFCSQPRADYGKFNLSWTGGGANPSRLSNWLDPSNTNATTLNLLSPPVISGSNTICSGTPKTFSATNWQSGFYWDKSSNLSLSSPTTNSTVTVSANGNGEGWVSVRNSNRELVRYYVWIGIPVIGSVINGPSTVTNSQINTFSITSPLLHSSFNFFWSATGGSYGVSSTYNSGNTNYAEIYFSPPGSRTLQVYASNSCGSCSPVYKSITVTGGGSDSLKSVVYPNPATDIININVDRKKDSLFDAPVPATTSCDIRIYDATGILRRQTKTVIKTAQLNVSDLPNGVYFLHIHDGINSKPEIQKILIAR